MKRRNTADEVLASVMRWNLAIVGGVAAVAVLACRLAGQPAIAWGIALGSSSILGSTFVSARVESATSGAFAGVSYVIKLAVILVAILVVDAWAAVDRMALLLAVAVCVVLNLVIDSWVILRQPGPDFDIPDAEIRED